jgi:hypothetical protein
MEPTVLVTCLIIFWILLSLVSSVLVLRMRLYRKQKLAVTERARKSYPLADDWFTIAESTGVGRDRRPKHRA